MLHAPETERRFTAYERTARHGERRRLMRRWGILSEVAGRLYVHGDEAVEFEWSVPGVELHARFGDARFESVFRHVVFTLGEDESILFCDGDGVPRGSGQLMADGAIWFQDAAPERGCIESGAIYSMHDAAFERQRFQGRSDAMQLLPAIRYESALDNFRPARSASFCA